MCAVAAESKCATMGVQGIAADASSAVVMKADAVELRFCRRRARSSWRAHRPRFYSQPKQ